MSKKINFSKELEEITNVVMSYNVEDLALDIQINYLSDIRETSNKLVSDKEKVFFLIAGDLTIGFKGENLLLKSIDSYTNFDLWKKEFIEIPSAFKRAKCSINGDFLDDRLSINDEVHYIFDNQKNLLKIKIGKLEDDCFYKIAEDLFIGTQNNEISSILVSNLDFS